jgi:F-type H+-transporting ATPase subunit delta
MAQQLDAAARVYADALHQAAVDAGRTREVDRDLQAFVGALAQNVAVLRALVNPGLPHEAKRRILARMFEQSDPLARNAVLVLSEHGRLGLLLDMQRAYAELAAEDENILAVEVTTAVELDKGTVSALAERISDAVGRQANVTAHVDPSLIGGLVLQARGVLVDASVKRRLEELRRAMIRTPLPVGSEA